MNSKISCPILLSLPPTQFSIFLFSSLLMCWGVLKMWPMSTIQFKFRKNSFVVLILHQVWQRAEEGSWLFTKSGSAVLCTSLCLSPQFTLLQHSSQHHTRAQLGKLEYYSANVYIKQSIFRIMFLPFRMQRIGSKSWNPFSKNIYFCK